MFHDDRLCLHVKIFVGVGVLALALLKRVLVYRSEGKAKTGCSDSIGGYGSSRAKDVEMSLRV